MRNKRKCCECKETFYCTLHQNKSYICGKGIPDDKERCHCPAHFKEKLDETFKEWKCVFGSTSNLTEAEKKALKNYLKSPEFRWGVIFGQQET